MIDMTTNKTSGALNRREAMKIALGGMALLVTPGFVGSALAVENAEVVKNIAAHFTSIRTMKGEFVQIGARGERSDGVFFIQRPGKVRFNYNVKSGFRVISDGKSVVLENPKMKTMDLYSLSQTPLKLLLGDQIDLSGDRVRSVSQEDGQVVIEMGDKSAFGDGVLKMIFDSQTYELRQWTITDAQNRDTTVMILNVQNNVPVDQKLFYIDYKKNYEINQKERQGG